jgi:hypothetical protein
MTETYTTDETPRETEPTPRASAFSLLAAPAAYGVAAVLNYFVAPAACQLGLSGSGFSLLRVITFLLTGLALLVTAWAAYSSYRNIQRARAAGATADESSRFLGVGGFMLSVLFTGLTIIAGLSGLAMQPCRPV